MKRISFLALAIAASSAFVGCGSDNKSEDPTPKSNSELLMAKSWKLTAFTYQEGTDPVEDNYAQLDACSKDDLYKFKASASFEYNENTNVCAGEPQSYSGNWALTNNDKTLTVAAANQATYSFVAIQGNIDELTANKLVVSETETFGGVKSVMKYTFVAQ